MDLGFELDIISSSFQPQCNFYVWHDISTAEPKENYFTMTRSTLESSLHVRFQVKPESLKPEDYPEILNFLKEILSYSQTIQAYSPSILNIISA